MWHLASVGAHPAAGKGTKAGCGCGGRQPTVHKLVSLDNQAGSRRRYRPERVVC